MGLKDVKSIAVLPFANMSDIKDSDFFADGITEEIINALTRISGLKVTSRTSSFYFKNQNIPIPKIAKELKVNLILEGSVRFSNNKARITAQLIQAENDFHFFSHTWDRDLDDIFEVQDEISIAISDKIREHFGHFEFNDHLVKQQTNNVSAYEYSLKARFHKNKWNPDDAVLAKDYYTKSLKIDPLHVESIIGLADIYSFMGMIGTMSFQEAWEKCNALIDKALTLDPNNAEAYYQKGHSAFFTECDFSKAMNYASKAIQNRPNYAEAQQLMSFLYVVSGNFIEAKKHLDIALGIDPLSQETLFFKAYYNYMNRNYNDAYNELSHCLEVNPKNIPAHAVLTLCLLKMGEFDKVIRYFDDLDVEVPLGEKTGVLALAYALKEDEVNAQKYFKMLQEQVKTPDGFASDSFLFMFYAVNGNIDQAFDWIEAAIENKSSLLMLRYPDPMTDILRQDKRFNFFQNKIYKAEVKTIEVSKADKKPLLDKKTAQTYWNKLIHYIDLEKPFLDAALSLRVLATKIDIHPNKLSWLINEMQEHNFNQFINNYRIAHFKKLALNPDNKQYSIIGLAYESGFNSKTVFNTYFKRSTGLSPKDWIKNQ